MSKIGFSLVMLMFGLSLSAQSIRLPAGKKMSVTAETKMASSTAVMGQQMDIENTITNISEIELKTVTNTGYIITATVKRIKASISISGQEQSFDSDEETSRNNPQMAALFAMLDKPNEIEVGEHGATIKGDIGAKALQMGIPVNANDQAKYILMQQEISKLTSGNHWFDSTVAEGNRMINEYTVNKTDDLTAEVLVKTTVDVNTTLQQFGMDIKQSMQGTINAKRLYTKSTGLLIKEESEMVMTGTMDIMGQSSPLNIKGKITTTVN